MTGVEKWFLTFVAVYTTFQLMDHSARCNDIESDRSSKNAGFVIEGLAAIGAFVTAMLWIWM